MRPTRTCSILSFALCGALIFLSSADAAIVQILVDNPDATNADFAQSFVEFDQCVAGGTSEQACYKILWDPPYITEGVMTVEISPFNGDISRIGRVLSVNFFNGYTGSGPFTRTDLVDRVRFDIPVVSVEAPPDPLPGLNIVELQLADAGIGQALFGFTISAQDLKVQLDNGTIDDNPTIKPKDVILGIDIDLTPEQQVPAPLIDGFDPGGQAALNLDMNAETGEAKISIIGSFSDLTSMPTEAHLRGPAGFGETADTILDLNINHEEGTFGIEEATLNATALSYLMAGKTYLDVATVNNDAGEIRGQIIPEPSSINLLLLGLFAMGHYRRQR